MDIKNLKLNYPKLAGLIKKYYYDNTEAGHSNLDDLINYKLINQKNYQKIWVKGILKTIEKELGQEVIDLTFGTIPNYGGMVYFNNKNESDKFVSTQIHFYVSLIENVISVQIIEMEETNRQIHPLELDPSLRIIKKIIVSPGYHHLDKVFAKIELLLNKLLVNPIFLPYSVDQTILDNLIIPHSVNIQNTVGDAFFKKFIPDNKDFTVIGNQDYRINQLS
ncbi:hypothetical protein ACFSQJ_15925 [Croceitalea marina]|uniref:Uncharacterized protein n=1 Tax=Croceitalea marina TaxID=1775166 RepID=A0ABW5MYH8_9FLAO